MSFEYLRDGHPVRVTLERSGETVRASVDEREVVLHSTAVDERQVRLITADGRHHRIVYAKRDGRTYVAARGAAIELAPHSDTSTDDAAGGGGFTPEIVAPMPGKILEVLVAVGDDVAHDAPLIRMEAMKMEQTIRAAAPAKVRRGACRGGRDGRAGGGAAGLGAAQRGVNELGPEPATLRSYCPGRRFARAYRSAAENSRLQLRQCWPVGDPANFAEQIVREREALDRGSRFELTAQVVRDVSNLDRVGHFITRYSDVDHGER